MLLSNPVQDIGKKNMLRTSLSLAVAAIATAAISSPASAGCYNCYTPPPQPCTTMSRKQML